MFDASPDDDYDFHKGLLGLLIGAVAYTVFCGLVGGLVVWLIMR